MGIKGLTEGARFPIIGQLRKGAPKPEQGNRPGKDLTFFRFTSEEPGLVETFNQVYGAEPRALEVYLPYASADENFEAYLEEYVASGLMRRCDGETLLLKREEDGEISDAGRSCERNKGCQCKPTGRLVVILPKLEHFSVVTVLTTSKHDIMNLFGALKRYEHVAAASGRDLSGIPFTLKRVPRKISTPAPDGKRARREKWLLSIEPSPAWVSVQLRQAQERAMLGGDTAPAQITDGGGVEISGEVQVVPTHALTGADPSVICELQIASTDFGFASRNRDLRLAFGSLVVGRDLQSFSEATNDEAGTIQDVLLSVMRALKDKAGRLAFAAYAVRCDAHLGFREDMLQALTSFAEARLESVGAAEDWNEDHPFDLTTKP